MDDESGLLDPTCEETGESRRVASEGVQGEKADADLVGPNVQTRCRSDLKGVNLMKSAIYVTEAAVNRAQREARRQSSLRERRAA